MAHLWIITPPEAPTWTTYISGAVLHYACCFLACSLALRKRSSVILFLRSSRGWLFPYVEPHCAVHCGRTSLTSATAKPHSALAGTLTQVGFLLQRGYMLFLWGLVGGNGFWLASEHGVGLGPRELMHLGFNGSPDWAKLDSGKAATLLHHALR